MQQPNLEDALNRILEQDPRFERDAYLFLREALDFTQRTLPKSAKGAPRHVSGRELLRGIADYALAEYGPMAMSVFEAWGVKRCEDWGEIVFALIEQGLLAKTETDTRADFAGGYDFHDALRKPFLPSARRALGTPASKPQAN